MLLIEVVAIIAFFALLAAAIFMVLSFYICDNGKCHAFTAAEDSGQEGSKEYTIALLNELYNDGIWPLPFIGAAILTGLSLWFIGVHVTTKLFAIVFLTSFITIYFLFAFFGHHYVKFISRYVSNYIEDNCPGVNVEDITINDNNVDLEGVNNNVIINDDVDEIVLEPILPVDIS